MIRPLRDTPIRTKLTMIIVGTTVILLALVFAGFLTFQWHHGRAVLQRSLRVQAHIVASNASAPLVFGDVAGAHDLLAALQVQPHVVGAVLLRTNQLPFASHGGETNIPPLFAGTNSVAARELGGWFDLCAPVRLDGKELGSLYIRFDARALERDMLLPYLLILAGCGAIAFPAALLFSASFQRVISRPILRLTQIARAVADRKDYSVRAEEAGRDELGTLTTTFNLMLGRIQQQDESLRDSEARYRHLFQCSPLPMFVHDDQTRAILAANDAATEHYGFSLDELLQLNFDALLAPDSTPVAPPPTPGKPKDLRPLSAVQHARHRRRDHSVIDVEITSHRIEFAGRAARLTLCLDITARRRAEQQLAVAFDDLEAKVAERTSELSEAKIAAEAASEAKSRFLAMMSHEIRTPLNGVTGVLHLLLRDHPTPQQRRRIEMAQNSAQTLLCVINDILDFSKVEAGKLELRSASTRLHATISNTAATFAYKAADKGLAWAIHIDPAVPRVVLADPDRLSQILGNLLSNAIKFTDAGSVAVTVTVATTSELRSASGRPPVRFEIADTGCGVPPSQIQRLFLPFSQLDNTTTRRHGGTGLGLGICKHLVELMGGRIGVDSQPGQGSVFWFELPFASAEDSHATESASAPAPAAAPAVPSLPHSHVLAHSKLVLLAEDNDINRELAQEMIHAAGCACECAANGDEAVQAVRTGRYDLVFMDCMMPGTDGYTASRIIRAEEIHDVDQGRPGRHIPIVAMTANAMAGDRETCLASGMDDYLAKPLHPDDVAAMLRKWLGLDETTTDGGPAETGSDPSRKVT